MGIVNSKLVGPQVSNISFAIPINYAIDMLRWNGVATGTTHVMPPVLSSIERARKVTRSTVLVRVTGGAAGQADFGASGTNGDASRLTRTNPKDGAEMVYIPAGEFVMGSGNPMTKDENTRHKVTLSGYWIYRNLVTVGMYKKFCADTGHPLRSAPAFDPSWVKDDHPILNVSWFDAAAYCAWATVSLPTEAQWEKAARGPTGSEYPWGDNYNLSKVWASSKVKGDAASTTAVGHFGVSGYGCTDMAGNAFQWCLDWYSKDFWSSRESQGIDPLNQSPGNMANRCVRGTDWVYFMTS